MEHIQNRNQPFQPQLSTLDETLVLPVPDTYTGPFFTPHGVFRRLVADQPLANLTLGLYWTRDATKVEYHHVIESTGSAKGAKRTISLSGYEHTSPVFPISKRSLAELPTAVHAASSATVTDFHTNQKQSMVAREKRLLHLLPLENGQYDVFASWPRQLDITSFDHTRFANAGHLVEFQATALDRVDVLVNNTFKLEFTQDGYFRSLTLVAPEIPVDLELLASLVSIPEIVLSSKGIESDQLVNGHEIHTIEKRLRGDRSLADPHRLQDVVADNEGTFASIADRGISREAFITKLYALMMLSSVTGGNKLNFLGCNAEQDDVKEFVTTQRINGGVMLRTKSKELFLLHSLSDSGGHISAFDDHDFWGSSIVQILNTARPDQRSIIPFMVATSLLPRYNFVPTNKFGNDIFFCDMERLAGILY